MQTSRQSSEEYGGAYRRMDSLKRDLLPPDLNAVHGQLPPQVTADTNVSPQQPNREMSRTTPPPLPQRQRSRSSHELLFSEGRENGYTYVVSMRFDTDGNPIVEEGNDYE